MLTAMLTVFLLGGGLMGGTILNPAEVEAIGERIEHSVNEPERLKAAKLLLGELESEIKKFDEIFVDSGDNLRDIFSDHAAGSRQMLTELERLNLEWYASQNRSVKLRTRLKESITADEWAKIFDAE